MALDPSPKSASLVWVYLGIPLSYQWVFLWCLTFEFTALEIRLNLVLMSYLQVVQETNAESGVALVLDQTSAELCNKVNKLVFSPNLLSFFFK